MVAIASGLMARPKLLMIDEPFLGLCACTVEEIAGLVRRIRDEQGISILFIEQNVELFSGSPTAAWCWSRAAWSSPALRRPWRSAEVKRIFLGEFAR